MIVSIVPIGGYPSLILIRTPVPRTLAASDTLTCVSPACTGSRIAGCVFQRTPRQVASTALGARLLFTADVVVPGSVKSIDCCRSAHEVEVPSSRAHLLWLIITLFTTRAMSRVSLHPAGMQDDCHRLHIWHPQIPCHRYFVQNDIRTLWRSCTRLSARWTDGENNLRCTSPTIAYIQSTEGPYISFRDMPNAGTYRTLL
jgi:hypothetical protein